MTRRQTTFALLAASLAAAGPTAQAKTIQLPPPRASGGKPLMDALKLRRSTREYSDRALEPQLLSDLLWSAFGINRPTTGDRTAPYWRHVMVIDVYVAMADGVWFYDPKPHALVLHQEDDLRARTGLQDFVAGAPLNLVYVAHGERMQRFRRGAAPLRISRCVLYRPECLSLLRIGRVGNRISRCCRQASFGQGDASCT